jgi:hypothetical protein
MARHSGARSVTPKPKSTSNHKTASIKALLLAPLQPLVGQINMTYVQVDLINPCELVSIKSMENCHEVPRQFFSMLNFPLPQMQ